MFETDTQNKTSCVELYAFQYLYLVVSNSCDLTYSSCDFTPLCIWIDVCFCALGVSFSFSIHYVSRHLNMLVITF